MNQLSFPKGVMPSQDGELIANVKGRDLFLEVLLAEQDRLQKRLGLTNFQPLLQKLEPVQLTIAYNLLALIVEAVEVLQEINWKPWKWRKPKQVDRKALLSELVDITQFWANAVNAAGFTAEEVKAAYREKLYINYQRAAEQEQPELPLEGGQHG